MVEAECNKIDVRFLSEYRTSLEDDLLDRPANLLGTVPFCPLPAKTGHGYVPKQSA